MDLSQLFNNWYIFLSSLNSALVQLIQSLSNGIGIPFLSAFLFGILGTTASCQLSTNFGALAFLARQPSERAGTLRATLSYVSAKILVYTLIGAVILTLGQGLVNAAGPLLKWARKAIGPAMILMGLAVLGAIRVRFQMGQRLAHSLEQRVQQADSLDRNKKAPAARGARGATQTRLRSPLANPAAKAALAGAVIAEVAAPLRYIASGTAGGAGSTGIADGPGGWQDAEPQQSHPGQRAPSALSGFLLGTAFSLAFCPTLALLFFGITMSLAARSAGGATFPAFFAVGTSLPLLILVGVALTGAGAVKRVRQGMRRANRPLRWVAGIALILLGLHDTLIYWFL